MSDSYEIKQPIANIGCQDLLTLMSPKCTHCGFMRKKRNIKLFMWPQAYVVLHDGCLYYFKDEKARKASGRFSLYGYNAVYRASEIQQKEAPWAIKIVHSHEEFKTYYFSAPSEQEMKTWMANIKREMLHANGKSALYGKNLQPVGKDAEKDELIDDPGFYQTVEQNIYDDSKKFVPSQDYQKKCSIKKENEDSDDEDLQMPDPAIFVDRPPVPLPHDNDPFLTLKTPSMPRTPLAMGEPPALPSGPPPHKPPRTTDLFPPHVPPHRNPPALPRDDPPPRPDFRTGGKVSHLTNMLQKVPLTPPTIKRKNRRGSYEKTNPQNITTSNGGSTGDDDQESSDGEDDWDSCYFPSADKQRASEIIQDLGEEGVYLVRPSERQDEHVLVVFAENQCKKYRIKQQSGKYYLAEAGHHDMRVNSLLKFYQRNTLPTVNAKLRIPYRRHPRYMD
ncbi:SH3 domain-binding protein 2-like isoform X2 [Mya arenaria]|nr:SH3 domain-binding protein 2-like isoform X2 [Mya arenaria]